MAKQWGVNEEVTAEKLTRIEQNIEDVGNSKQANLISGSNIKTINGNSLLGSGNLNIGGSSLPSGLGITTNELGNLQIYDSHSGIKYIGGDNYSLQIGARGNGNFNRPGEVRILSNSFNTECNIYENGQRVYSPNNLPPGSSMPVDNLNSTSTTSSLSANQGRVLNNNKQATLVSGSNIKTINGNSLLGSGNLNIGGASSLPNELGITTNSSGYLQIYDSKNDMRLIGSSGSNIQIGAPGEGVFSRPSNVIIQTDNLYVEDMDRYQYRVYHEGYQPPKAVINGARGTVRLVLSGTSLDIRTD